MSTSIEWTDETFSPMTGCSRTASPACDHCWASSFMHRGLRPEHRGLTVVRTRTIDGVESTEPDWNGKVHFYPERLAVPFHWKMPRRCFPNSISDTFHPRFALEQVAAFYGMMIATPYVTYQCLTKRPERALEFYRWLASEARPGSSDAPRACLDALENALQGVKPKLVGRIRDAWASSPTWPPKNVWFGVSVANQEDADRWIPLALEVPAALHWVSYEPALGPVDFSRWLPRSDDEGRCVRCGLEWPDERESLEHECPSGFGPRLSWCVAGGESGPHARPFNVAWAEQTIEQFRAALTPCFVKQVGRRPYADLCPEPKIRGGYNHFFMFPGARSVKVTNNGNRMEFELHDKHGGDWDEWPEHLRVREFPKPG